MWHISATIIFEVLLKSRSLSVSVHFQAHKAQKHRFRRPFSHLAFLLVDSRVNVQGHVRHIVDAIDLRLWNLVFGDSLAAL